MTAQPSDLWVEIVTNRVLGAIGLRGKVHRAGADAIRPIIRDAIRDRAPNPESEVDSTPTPPRNP